jgi:hypothetical protein
MHWKLDVFFNAEFKKVLALSFTEFLHTLSKNFVKLLSVTLWLEKNQNAFALLFQIKSIKEQN